MKSTKREKLNEIEFEEVRNEMEIMNEKIEIEKIYNSNHIIFLYFLDLIKFGKKRHLHFTVSFVNAVS